jgi:hypothetical protein
MDSLLTGNGWCGAHADSAVDSTPSIGGGKADLGPEPEVEEDHGGSPHRSGYGVTEARPRRAEGTGVAAPARVDTEVRRAIGSSRGPEQEEEALRHGRGGPWSERSYDGPGSKLGGGPGRGEGP